MKFLAEIPANASVLTAGGKLLIVSPDAPPYFLRQDGTREEIEFSFDADKNVPWEL